MYKLVTLASRRALELSEGAPRMVEMPKDTKVTTVALKEIAEGKLVFKKEEKEKENKTSAA